MEENVTNVIAYKRKGERKFQPGRWLEISIRFIEGPNSTSEAQYSRMLVLLEELQRVNLV